MKNNPWKSGMKYLLICVACIAYFYIPALYLNDSQYTIFIIATFVVLFAIYRNFFTENESD